MKKVFMFLFVFVVLLVFSLQAYAELILRGTDINGNRLIYDTDFNITWYDYTKSVDYWQNQMNWADALSVTFGSNTYTDWRLPATITQDCEGYNCTNSEMGHLYYTELGNVSYTYSSSSYGLSNKGDFQKLLSNSYWSGTEYAANTVAAGYFGNYLGDQGFDNKYLWRYAIAVRPGDVAVVPEPVSMILFGIGGVVLGARRIMKRQYLGKKKNLFDCSH